ncbi:pH-response regulator protein palA/rim20, partial [Podila epigama]
NAAGAFQHLRDAIVPELRITPTVDISSPALTVYIQLMLAQAQECSWQKCALDQVKDRMIAKIAAKVAEFYDTAFEGATHSSMTALFPIQWTSQMQAKAFHFNAVAQYRKACDCISRNKYGEEIARLQIAERLVNSGLELQRNLKEAVVNDLRSLQTAIHRNLSRAEKDNDIIYLEPIPAETTLEDIGKAEMCKATIVPEISNPVPLMNEHNMLLGVPLFSRLVPFAVHQAASVYTERKERIVKEDIGGKFDELTGICYSQMQHMNLPGSLQALEQPVELPPTLIQHIEEMTTTGGMRVLHEMLETVRTLSRQNGNILEEIFEALQEEANEDEAMRRRYRGRWNRPTSASLTVSFVEQGMKHRKTLEDARKSDHIAEVERAVPSSTNAPGSSDPEIVVDLKLLLEEAEGMIKGRRIKLEEVKRMADEDDIGPALVAITNKLTASSSAVKIEPAHFEALFQERLKKYDGYKKLVREETVTQEHLLMALEETNKSFVASRRSNAVVHQREMALQNLESAFQKYKVILSNIQEGLQFHRDFEKILVRLRDSCRDYFFARKMEARDYITEVTAELSQMDLSRGQPSSPAPSAPPSGGNNAGWSPNLGVRFAPPQQQQQQQQQQQPSPPDYSSATPPGSAFTYDHGTTRPQDRPSTNSVGHGTAPTNFAQQLEQQFRQMKQSVPPAASLNSVNDHNNNNNHHHQNQNNNNHPSTPPPPSPTASNQAYPPQASPRPPTATWDPSKGIFFGGKPKK